MIVGIVNADLEAVVRVAVSGPAGQVNDVEAVVDTGYNGLLTLPSALVGELGLPYVTRSRATLANGSEDICDVHDATVLWDSQPRHVRVDATDATPLVGMALLEGHNLHIDVHNGGRATIEANERDQHPAV